MPRPGALKNLKRGAVGDRAPFVKQLQIDLAAGTVELMAVEVVRDLGPALECVCLADGGTVRIVKPAACMVPGYAPGDRLVAVRPLFGTPEQDWLDANVDARRAAH